MTQNNTELLQMPEGRHLTSEEEYERGYRNGFEEGRKVGMRMKRNIGSD